MRRWVTWRAPVADADDFPQLGAAYETTGAVRVGPVGNAESRLIPQRPLVDFTTTWLSRNRRT